MRVAWSLGPPVRGSRRGSDVIISHVNIWVGRVRAGVASGRIQNDRIRIRMATSLWETSALPRLPTSSSAKGGPVGAGPGEAVNEGVLKHHKIL